MQDPFVSNSDTHAVQSQPARHSSGEDGTGLGNLEPYFTSSIQWFLRQSRSPQFTADVRMKLLERAWQIQKKVWEMRGASGQSIHSARVALLNRSINLQDSSLLK